MKVYKFGGASIKDYKSVKRLARIIRKHNHDEMVLIVSAMGKTTNSMEDFVLSYTKSFKNLKNKLELIKSFHKDIVKDLFQKNQQSVLKIIESVFNEIDKFLKLNKENDYNFIYDQLVSYGEILSSVIISEYLNSIGLKSKWVDARSCIKTDQYYRDANVDFEKTSKSIKRKIKGKGLFISQDGELWEKFGDPVDYMNQQILSEVVFDAEVGVMFTKRFVIGNAVLACVQCSCVSSVQNAI